MDLPGRALLPGLRITYDLAFEGIIYLTKSDEDFQRTYVWGDKPWF